MGLRACVSGVEEAAEISHTSCSERITMRVSERMTHATLAQTIIRPEMAVGVTRGCESALSRKAGRAENLAVVKHTYELASRGVKEE